MTDKTDKHQAKKITPRSQDYAEWYQDIIDVADLAEHSAVRGSMIIKPYGYAIWENMQRVLDGMFKETGIENAYFPLLIPESFLNREKSHVEGFSPELAVVTHAGGKKLDEPYVIRPTSETIIYDAYSKWVESYRDLPILINQWANVVRWELRPRLFLRTTEFLWQEGHTVHATEKEADDRARQMLDVYAEFVEEYLAIPVLKGIKSDKERFAGALKTYAIEAMMQDGKALQMGTSHNLGQNFAKVFDLKFTDQDGKYQYCWQTSWGVSTRMIGGLIMAHSDDKGLVVPPKIAPIKTVIITVWSNEEEKKKVLEAAEKVSVELKEVGILNKLDARDMRIGEKIYEWEKKGIPVRIEIGPKDIAKDSVMVARRDTSEKTTVKNDEIIDSVTVLLEQIQKNLFDRALKLMKEKTVSVDNWEDFKKKIEEGNFVVAHWDGTSETEKKITEETKATIRCMPFDQKEEPGKCVYSGKPSTKRVIFAKAY